MFINAAADQCILHGRAISAPAKKREGPDHGDRSRCDQQPTQDIDYQVGDKKERRGCPEGQDKAHDPNRNSKNISGDETNQPSAAIAKTAGVKIREGAGPVKSEPAQ